MAVSVLALVFVVLLTKSFLLVVDNSGECEDSDTNPTA